MAPRERMLAVGVVAALGVLLVVTTIMRAGARLDEMDDMISRFEADLLMYTELEARRVNIEAAYSVVAQQHSSEWSESEIENRLRQEIYRLARRYPDAPADSQQDNLVEIPRMRQGRLRDSGDGYREYLLSVDIPPAPVSSILEFLVRLHESPQSLRVDRLEISRAPHLTQVGVQLEVTRTIVDGVPGRDQAPQQRVETWQGATVEPWQAENCDLTLSEDMNGTEAATGRCLEAVALKQGAAFLMTADINEPGTYEVEVSAMATGPAVLRVKNLSTAEFLEGSTELAGDSGLYRYKMRFTLETPHGESARVAVPHITISEAGAKVFVDLVTLGKVSG